MDITTFVVALALIAIVGVIWFVRLVVSHEREEQARARARRNGRR